MHKIFRFSFILIVLQYMFIYADPPMKHSITLQQKNAFKNEVFRYLRYFRIPTSDIELSFSEIENNNILFSAVVQSRRNNFEEVLVKTYACIGRVMIAVPDGKMNKGQLLILPSIINVQCHVPVGRDDTYFSTTANTKEVIQFTNGVITAEGFLASLKETMDGSFVPYSNKSVSSIMNTDVDFENLIAVRMALEGKNNPRLSSVLTLASKAKYIPGLEKKIEVMMLDKIKSKHWDLMTETFGYSPSDKQIKRIGKQVFYHIQMESTDIINTHMNDSLRYVWKGRRYPEPLNVYYRDYNAKYGIKRPSIND
mgnify:CR=1 FL=1